MFTLNVSFSLNKNSTHIYTFSMSMFSSCHSSDLCSCMHTSVSAHPSILSDLGFLFALTKLISAAFTPPNIEFLFEKQLAVKSGATVLADVLASSCSAAFYLSVFFILSIHSM